MTKRSEMKKNTDIQICLDRIPVNSKDEKMGKARPNENGLYPVTIRLYHNRKYQYYSTGVFVDGIEEYKHIFDGKRRTKEEKDKEAAILFQKTKAGEIIKALKIFTFSKFEEGYFESRDINNDISYAFDKRIGELKENGQVGTAVTYDCAKNSLFEYNPKLTFAEITPLLLRKYEKWMLDNGRSITTVSMYLRCLRAIFNNQTIDKTVYPFGRGKGKYSIPTGRNVKKALTLDEVAKIYNYEPETDTEEMTRDYWMFMYLCNGMNVKDLCLLKWENIQGDIIDYERAKTSTTGREKKAIRIALKAESKAIIRKWGNPSLNKSAFIFPHLEAGMTPERQRRIYQDLTKQINKYIQRIGKKLEIPQHITTYSARHSFATVLKRSGANISMISDLLGHSDLSVTQKYLDSFEDEQIQTQTDVLTTGFKTGNQNIIALNL